MIKLSKWLLVLFIPLFSLAFASCSKDDDNDLENSNNQPTISDEFLINSYNSLVFYEDDKFVYAFTPSGLGARLISIMKNENGDTEYYEQPIDGEWPCGMKKFERQADYFESFSTKLTDYTSKPVTFINGANRGDIYAVYVRTAKGNYRHYKIRINDIGFDRQSNGLLKSIKYMKVVYMSY